MLASKQWGRTPALGMNSTIVVTTTLPIYANYIFIALSGIVNLATQNQLNSGGTGNYTHTSISLVTDDNAVSNWFVICI